MQRAVRKGLAAASVSRISREKTVNAVLMDSMVIHFVSVSIQMKMPLFRYFICALKNLQFSLRLTWLKDLAFQLHTFTCSDKSVVVILKRIWFILRNDDYLKIK